ncbi:MAG: heavy-metal-associated domain-containing protein [Prolixibacteraceae bacterium]
MKRIVLITIILMIGAFVSQTFAQKKGNSEVWFKSNMDCGKCEKSVYEYLKFEKGVKDLKVDHVSNTIYIEYKSKKNSDAELAKAIEKKGFKAEKISEEKYKEIVAQAKEQGHTHGTEVHHKRE